MNAINLDLLDGLEEALSQIADDNRTRVVILKGAGGNFCSGVDIAMVSEGWGESKWLDIMRQFGRIILAIKTIPQPVIVQLEGVAYGGGFNLCLSGDLIIASHSARLCQVFVNVGAVLDGGGTYLLPRILGMAKAKELALLGEEIDGKKAASMGLIFRSVRNEFLTDEVNALAVKLSKKPFKAMSLIKQGLEVGMDMDLKAILEWEAAHQATMLCSDDYKKFVHEFLVSRKK